MQISRDKEPESADSSPSSTRITWLLFFLFLDRVFLKNRHRARHLFCHFPRERGSSVRLPFSFSSSVFSSVFSAILPNASRAFVTRRSRLNHDVALRITWRTQTHREIASLAVCAQVTYENDHSPATEKKNENS